LVEPNRAIKKGQHLDATFVPPASTQVKPVHLGLRKVNPETMQNPQIVRPNEDGHFHLKGPQTTLTIGGMVWRRLNFPDLTQGLMIQEV
jgi:hypothetical protein